MRHIELSLQNLKIKYSNNLESQVCIWRKIFCCTEEKRKLQTRGSLGYKIYKSTAAMNYFFSNMTNTVIFMTVGDLRIHHTTAILDVILELLLDFNGCQAYLKLNIFSLLLFSFIKNILTATVSILIMYNCKINVYNVY
jgi:hypothetical protein